MPSRAKPQGDTHSRRPVLIVVAGPNGAGKTSLTQAILRHRWPEVDRGYVYDNSAEGVLPALQFRTVSGAVQKVYTEGHRWSDDLRACMLQTRPAPRTVANPRKDLPQDGPERSRGRSKPTVR